MIRLRQESTGSGFLDIHHRLNENSLSIHGATTPVVIERPFSAITSPTAETVGKSENSIRHSRTLIAANGTVAQLSGRAKSKVERRNHNLNDAKFMNLSEGIGHYLKSQTYAEKSAVITTQQLLSPKTRAALRPMLKK